MRHRCVGDRLDLHDLADAQVGAPAVEAKQRVVIVYQRLVELEQCRRPDQRAKLREPVRAHEQRGQAEEDAIGRSEIGRPLPGAITDEQLVLEQQGLGGDGADATGAEELRKGDQQVDGKEDDLSHRASRTITAGTCKTARGARIASHWEFATHKRYA